MTTSGLKNKGFTLIELMIVVGVSGILLSIATWNFNAWMKKGRVEKQVKEMYSELQNARVKAAYTKKIYKVVFSANSMAFRSYTTVNDVGGRAESAKALEFPLTLSSWSNPAADRIEFDASGFSSDPVSPKLLCVFSSYRPAYDAVLIMQAKTSMGQLANQGGGCVATNVVPK